MDSAVKLIEALAKLFGSVAWPVTVAIVVLVVLARHRGAVDKAIDRVEKIVAPGGVEIALGDVLKEHEQQVVDKAVEVAHSGPADRRSAVKTLVSEVRRHSELESLLLVLQDKSLPEDMRQIALDKMNTDYGFAVRLGQSGDTHTYGSVQTIKEYDKQLDVE